MARATEKIDRLWAEFKRTDSVVLRNQLMEHYLPLVRRVAERLLPKLPPEVELDDLISHGSLGLMHAVRLFDPSRGYKFGTLATPRIWGSMIDGLRKLDWTPRHIRDFSKRLASEEALHMTTHGEKPTPQQLRKKLRLSEKHFTHAERARTQTVGSLFHKQAIDGEGHELLVVDTTKDARQTDPGKRLEDRESFDAVIRLVLQRYTLSDALMLRLYYVDGHTLKEIGGILGGVSEATMCQRRISIIRKVRSHYRLPERGTAKGAV